MNEFQKKMEYRKFAKKLYKKKHPMTEEEKSAIYTLAISWIFGIYVVIQGLLTLF